MYYSCGCQWIYKVKTINNLKSNTSYYNRDNISTYLTNKI